jgi:hypothetical protein
MDKSFIDYFMKQTNERFDKIEGKLDELLTFKWQIIGGSVLLSLMLTAGIQAIYLMTQK